MTTKPRLKQLELHGYKTFAGRVYFEFPGNVTAIVGPNGSGKSNIADALRWVLGEQSYTLLRGKKTEDMIFLGSDQRPRAGMASATITFDNENGWLPIDYSEVAVSRRAYRDGGNEYLLNKQKVRLKDISELLAQSGLAERTYTIIGQGLVDAALSLRPEERRRFFEEAAGIGLFRSRREESLTRLDTTKRNLERATDILSELEPRLRSLERQAKRVEEYDRVKADLHVLLKDWYGFHWQNSQKELIRNREILKNQEEKVNTARDRRTTIEKKVDEARISLQNLRVSLNQWHTESSNLHSQREKISKEIAVLEERLRASLDQEVSYEAELTRNEEHGTSLSDKLESAKLDLDRVNREHANGEQELEEIKKSFDIRDEERRKQENIQAENRKNLVESETRLVQLKAHVRELQNRLETQSASQVSLLDGISKTENEIEQSREGVSNHSLEKTKAETKFDETESELIKVKVQIQKTEEEIKLISKEVSQLSTDAARTKAQIEVLQQAENALTGMAEGAKNLILAVQSGKVKGKLQAINQLLDVPAEFEVAISSVLGEQLDAVMLDSSTDTENILRYLESDESGRTILIPTSGGRTTDGLRKIQDTNVIGIASDLVRGQGDFQKLISLLLGNVLIVSDRATAQNLVLDIPVWGKIVTLKGEVFSGNGIITAGREKRSGIISRPRQRKDLEAKLEVYNDDLNDNEIKVRNLQRKLDDLNSRKKSFDLELRENQAQLSQATQANDTASRNLVQVTQLLEWQNGQIKTLLEQGNATQREISENQAQIDSELLRVAEINKVIREANEALKLIPIDDLQAQLVHWNTSVALSERFVLEGERRVREAETTLQQNITFVGQIRQRIAGLKTQILDAETGKTNYKNEEIQLNSSIAKLQENIDPAEAELHTLESQYSLLQQDYSQTQQFETNADRVYSQAHLELARSREALESLRRKIEEDFGLVALEYSEDVTGPTPLPLEGVNQLVALTEIPKELEESINRQRALLRRMGAINPDAQKEYLEVRERFEFMTSQVIDLQKADADLRQIIAELDELMHKQFRTTFNAVASEFKQMFTRLFGGGSARLIMTDDENPTETGIDIEAKLPGRREQGLSLLSGGERSLTAVALIFSLLRVSPTPFCVLDEVDAMLDEANVGRFTELLKELSQETQFIVITHNRNTVQVADVIYGVTMGRDSASQVISLRLDELSEEMVK